MNSGKDYSCPHSCSTAKNWPRPCKQRSPLRWRPSRHGPASDQAWPPCSQATIQRGASTSATSAGPVERVGLASWLHELPQHTTTADLLHLVDCLNADPVVHGILVQLPLPPQIDEGAVLRAVTPLKDVDGFGPENLGLLAAGQPRLIPPTPHGVQQLLLRHGIDPGGRHVVIVGRSTIVGKPLALLLMRKAAGANATVTVCHSGTVDVGTLTRQADIVVMAVGRARFLKADMIRPGAAVVDVGTNRLADGSQAGDVDFEGVRQAAGAISPVPGGVGPMTITMLLHNTLHAAELQLKP